MPVTTITHTIKSAGGDYSSLSAWESAQQRDLTSGTAISGTITGTDGQIEKAEIYNFDLAEVVAINGWTTTASNFVWLFVPTDQRHDGRPRDTSATGFRIHAAGAGGVIFSVHPNHYQRIEGLEIYCTSTVADGRCAFRISTTGTTTNGDTHLKECIVQSNVGSGTAGALQANTNLARIRLTNTLIVSGGVCGMNCSAATFARLDFCTILRTASHAAVNSGLTMGPQTHVWNTYVGRFATDFEATGLATTRGGYNASLDSTATLRFGTTAISLLSASQQFVDFGATIHSLTLDTHLSASSGLIDKGSSTTTATIDIDSGSRS
jgi:hypothetical protein